MATMILDNDLTNAHYTPDSELGRLVNDCRVNRMGAEEWGWNSPEMKNMTAAISLQSRGMPVQVAIDVELRWRRGRPVPQIRVGAVDFGDQVR